MELDLIFKIVGIVVVFFVVLFFIVSTVLKFMNKRNSKQQQPFFDLLKTEFTLNENNETYNLAYPDKKYLNGFIGKYELVILSDWKKIITSNQLLYTTKLILNNPEKQVTSLSEIKIKANEYIGPNQNYDEALFVQKIIVPTAIALSGKLREDLFIIKKTLSKSSLNINLTQSGVEAIIFDKLDSESVYHSCKLLLPFLVSLNEELNLTNQNENN